MSRGTRKTHLSVVATPRPQDPGGQVKFSEVAFSAYQSPNPDTRFTALRVNQLNSIAYLKSRGASVAEVHMAVTLAKLLDEVATGNYSNPMWPKKKGGEKRGRRQPTFDRSQAFGSLMGLIESRIELDKISTEEASDRAENRVATATTFACSRVAYDLDCALKVVHASVEQWAPVYTKARRTTGSDKTPIFDGGRPLHKLTRRLEEWHGGDPPKELRSGDDAESTLEWVRGLLNDVRSELEERQLEAITRHYDSLVHTTADLMRWSMPASPSK